MTILTFLKTYGEMFPDWKQSCRNLIARAKKTKTHNEDVLENNNDYWLASELPLTIAQVHQFSNNKNTQPC